MASSGTPRRTIDISGAQAYSFHDAVTFKQVCRAASAQHVGLWSKSRNGAWARSELLYASSCSLVHCCVLQLLMLSVVAGAGGMRDRIGRRRCEYTRLMLACRLKLRRWRPSPTSKASPVRFDCLLTNFHVQCMHTSWSLRHCLLHAWNGSTSLRALQTFAAGTAWHP